MKKIIIVIISVVLILAAVAVGVTAYASDGYTLPVSEWGDRLGINDEQKQPEDQEKPGEEVPDEQQPDGSIIVNPLGVQIDTTKIDFTNSEVPSQVYVKGNAKILSATVLPEQTTYKDLIWSVEFVDPSAEWAADKNASDYIKITPAEDTLSVSIECLQPFGEEIAITAMCKQNSSLKDSCIVGFTQYVESYVITYDSLGFSYNTAPPPGYFSSDFECTSGIDGPEHTIMITYTLSQVFTNKIAEYIGVSRRVYGWGGKDQVGIGLDRLNSEWSSSGTMPGIGRWNGTYIITFNMDRDILTPPSGTTFDDKSGDEIAELIKELDTLCFSIQNDFGIPPVDIYVTLNPICTQTE